MNQQTNEENVQKLRELIKDIDFAMLTTVESDGTLRSRPMSTQDVEFDGYLWFFTSDKSGKAREIMHDRHVNLSYAKPDDNIYISVSGKGSISHDRAKMKEFWNPFYKAWFPEGLETPDIALLKVTVTQAEYWDSSGSKLMHLVGFVKAVATGEEYEPGENEKIKF